jgi:hypothetical protein
MIVWRGGAAPACHDRPGMMVRRDHGRHHGLVRRAAQEALHVLRELAGPSA